MDDADADTTAMSGLSTLNSQLDVGGESCLFLTAYTHRPLMTHLLFPNHLHQNKSNELYHLLEGFKTLAPAIRKQLVPWSVAKWIFLTNRIENAGTTTEGDTHALISGLQTGPEVNLQQKNEVLSTFKLLQESFCNPEKSRSFDVARIQKWHGMLMQCTLGEGSGKLRNSGVYADSNHPHVYPHHSILAGVLEKLCKVVHYYIGKNSSIQSRSELILKTFALAAFAQFHFVDIHPFIDGNGRMCRFLSKYLLDPICPVPFPMFLDRDSYLDALIQGRKAAAHEAPSLLLDLLLDSAITYYRDILQQYTDYKTRFYLHVESMEDLTHQLKANNKCTQEILDILTPIFECLSSTQQEEVLIGGEIFKIFRIEPK